MGIDDEIVDGAIKALEKLDGELAKAENTATGKTKERIQKFREKIKISDLINELKDWKKKPKDSKALDILIKILDKLAGELPAPIEKTVKVYLEALSKAFPTAYHLALKNLEKDLTANATDPEKPTDDELDHAAKAATNNKTDQEYLKVLWKIKHLKNTVVDEKEDNP